MVKYILLFLLIPAIAFGVELDTDSNGAIDVNRGGTNAQTAAGIRSAINVEDGAEANEPLVSQSDAEAGTSETEYSWSPLRIAQAIAALASSTSSFLGLSDTPAAYTGQGGKAVTVKVDETGLEFTDVGGGGIEETDPAFLLWLSTTPPVMAESDPFFTEWLSTFVDSVGPTYSFGTGLSEVDGHVICTVTQYSDADIDGNESAFTGWDKDSSDDLTDAPSNGSYYARKDAKWAAIPSTSETDPVFSEWLIATPPLYSESDPAVGTHESTYDHTLIGTALQAEVDGSTTNELQIASTLPVTTTNFGGHLANDATSDTVQECLDLLDDIISGGSSIILDIGDDTGNDSTALGEIATSGDTNSIITESASDKMLINMANDWPKADLADGLSAGFLVTETETIAGNDNDTTVPSCAAVKGYVADAVPESTSVTTFGAVGDGESHAGCAINASDSTLTCASSIFVAGDAGKSIRVPGAGAAGANLRTTIASYTSGTEVELTATASTTVAGKTVVYGTDDTAAFESAIAAQHATNGGVISIPDGMYIITDDIVIDRPIRWEGAGGTFMDLSGTYAGSVLFWNGTAEYFFSLTSQKGVFFKNMVLDCDGQATIAIYADRMQFGGGENINIKYPSYCGIYFDATGGVANDNTMFNVFTKTTIIMYGTYGIYFDSDSQIQNSCHNSFYGLNILFYSNNGQYGIYGIEGDNNSFVDYWTSALTGGATGTTMAVYAGRNRTNPPLNYGGFYNNYFNHIQAMCGGVDIRGFGNVMLNYDQINGEVEPTVASGTAFTWTSANGTGWNISGAVAAGGAITSKGNFLNVGATAGESGMGIKNNSGALQYKVGTAASWVNFPAGAASTAETTTAADTTKYITPGGMAGSTYGAAVSGVIVNGLTALTTGDGKAYILIPAVYNGFNLKTVSARVQGASSSGAVNVQVRNTTTAHDMLSTPITIDESETSTATAATAAVVSTSYYAVSTGDWIAIDVDGAGTGVTWLYVSLTFNKS